MQAYYVKAEMSAFIHICKHIQACKNTNIYDAHRAIGNIRHAYIHTHKMHIHVLAQ